MDEDDARDGVGHAGPDEQHVDTEHDGQSRYDDRGQDHPLHQPLALNSYRPNALPAGTPNRIEKAVTTRAMSVVFHATPSTSL